MIRITFILKGKQLINFGKEIYKKMAKNYSSLPNMSSQQYYDYFLVLDFEATCEDGVRIQNPEIIEFPVLKVDGKTFEVTDQFHEYVKPTLRPTLSDFCTKLTGINQDIVSQSETFPVVFSNFQQWMAKSVGLDSKFLFVTCGDWDLKSMLPDQCRREKIQMPSYFDTWMNIKKTSAHVTGTFVKGMIPMMQQFNIKHEGRHHSGIDDCRNIARILKELSSYGILFRPTTGNKRPPVRTHKDHHVVSVPNPPGAATANESLYPSLNECESSANRSASLYEPDGVDESRVTQQIPGERTDQCFLPDDNPNYEVMIVKLKENMCSKTFKDRDREELPALCAAGKYLNEMANEDRLLIQSRIQMFYIALVHGWKVAKRYVQDYSTESVGIRIEPELMAYSKQRKNVRSGMKKRYKE